MEKAINPGEEKKRAGSCGRSEHRARCSRQPSGQLESRMQSHVWEVPVVNWRTRICLDHVNTKRSLEMGTQLSSLKENLVIGFFGKPRCYETCPQIELFIVPNLMSLPSVNHNI